MPFHRAGQIARQQQQRCIRAATLCLFVPTILATIPDASGVPARRYAMELGEVRARIAALPEDKYASFSSFNAAAAAAAGGRCETLATQYGDTLAACGLDSEGTWYREEDGPVSSARYPVWAAAMQYVLLQSAGPSKPPIEREYTIDLTLRLTPIFNCGSGVPYIVFKASDGSFKVLDTAQKTVFYSEPGLTDAKSHFCVQRYIQGHSSPLQLGTSEIMRDGCPAPSLQVGNPINVESLNKVQHVIDHASPDGLPWQRTYNSGVANAGGRVAPAPSAMGAHWRHHYDRSLTSVYRSPPGSDAQPYLLLQMNREDGKSLQFAVVNGVIDPDHTLPGTLTTQDKGESFTFEHYDGTVEHYGRDGRLSSLVDQDRRVLRMHHDRGLLRRVEGPSGRTLQLAYDDDGRVAEVTLPDGHAISYHYAGVGRDGNLASVVFADGSRQDYLYDEPAYSAAPPGTHLLTGIMDEGGSRFSTYTYDAQGRATSSEHAGGVNRIEVVQRAGVRDVRDAAGGLTTYAVATGGERRRLNSIGGKEPATYRYDSSGDMTEFVLKGITSRISRDPLRGLEVSRTETSMGRPALTTLTRWHPHRRLLSERVRPTIGDVPGVREAFTYTQEGLLALTWTEPAEALSVGGDVQPGAEARAWRFARDEAGRVVQVDGPRDDVMDHTHLSYHQADAAGCAAGPCPYRSGDLQFIRNALGHTDEVLARDGAGRVTQMLDANGVHTQLDHDARGWLRRVEQQSMDGRRAITTLDRLPTGQLSTVTDADGVKTTLTYDAAQRLVAMTDAGGDQIRRTLDAAGRETGVELVDAAGRVRHAVHREYDVVGNMLKETGAEGSWITYAWDTMRRLTQQRAPAAPTGENATRLTWDNLRSTTTVVRMVGTTQGMSAQQTRYLRDRLDRVAAVTDPKGLTTRYQRNAFGDIVRQESPDTGVTRFDYDAAGNLSTRTDARGTALNIAYDALDRPVSMHATGVPADQRFEYDVLPSQCDGAERHPVGRLSRMHDGATTTHYCYNAAGDVTSKQQSGHGVRLGVQYQYSKAGRLLRMTYPDGSAVRYERDVAGHVRALWLERDGQGMVNLLWGVEYLPFGPITQWTDHAGRLLRRSYDREYRATAVEDASEGGLSLSIGYDAAGLVSRITEWSGGAAPTLGFHYDAFARLVRTVDAETGTDLERYHYDSTGNRTRLEGTASPRTTYTYAPNSHRLIAVNGVPRHYDAAGNMTEDARRGLQFDYNESGRLQQVRDATGVVRVRYTYNAKGEMVTREADGVMTHLVHDEEGRWLGDYDSAGKALQQVIWLEQHPVALLAGGRVYHIQSDHLGTPRVVIDAGRNVPVWRWSLRGEAFGSTAPEEDPDADGETFTLHLRFPGQRFDPVTQLHYNYFRDYDPVTGRYVQSDPIGLEGGISTYAYVEGNPLGLVDPDGRQFLPVSRNYNKRSSSGQRLPDDVASDLNVIWAGVAGGATLGTTGPYAIAGGAMLAPHGVAAVAGLAKKGAEVCRTPEFREHALHACMAFQLCTDNKPDDWVQHETGKHQISERTSGGSGRRDSGIYYWRPRR